MTRHEAKQLRSALDDLDSDVMVAKAAILMLLMRAQDEFDAEDRALDAMFGKDTPINLHQQAAE